MLIDSNPRLKIVGEAGNRSEALSLAAAQLPDLILLDLDLGDENGLDFLPDLLAAAPQSKAIILTALRDSQTHLRAVQLGALGIVLKEQADEKLFQAIEKVHRGEVWLDSALVAKSLTQRHSTLAKTETMDSNTGRINSLTPREREIIELVCQGMKNQQIADRLFISEGTVRNHLTLIYSKLDVADRFGLIVFAIRHRLVIQPTSPN